MPSGRTSHAHNRPEKVGIGILVTRAQFLRLPAVPLATAGINGLPGRAAATGGGVLTVGISSDIKTLDPHKSSLDVFRHTIRSTIFEALVFTNPDTLSADPRLAISWETSADGLTVTF